MNFTDALLLSDLRDRIFVTRYTRGWPTKMQDVIDAEYKDACIILCASPICIYFSTKEDLLIFALKYGGEHQPRWKTIIND